MWNKRGFWVGRTSGFLRNEVVRGNSGVCHVFGGFRWEMDSEGTKGTYGTNGMDSGVGGGGKLNISYVYTLSQTPAIPEL